MNKTGTVWDHTQIYLHPRLDSILDGSELNSATHPDKSKLFLVLSGTNFDRTPQYLKQTGIRSDQCETIWNPFKYDKINLGPFKTNPDKTGS